MEKFIKEINEMIQELNKKGLGKSAKKAVELKNRIMQNNYVKNSDKIELQQLEFAMMMN